MRRWSRAYGPAIFWAAALLLIGSCQDPPSPDFEALIPIDKVAHFFMYGILGALAAWGWDRSGRDRPWLIPLVAVWIVGAIDELHQIRVPNRTAEFADWIADVLGASVAFIFVSRWARAARKWKNNES